MLGCVGCCSWAKWYAERAREAMLQCCNQRGAGTTSRSLRLRGDSLKELLRRSHYAIESVAAGQRIVRRLRDVGALREDAANVLPICGTERRRELNRVCLIRHGLEV